MSLRTPLSHAKGLGTAKEGVSHWWVQRVTAVALVPLVLWMTFSIAGLVGADYGVVVEWFRSPVNTALLVLFLVVMFHHLQLGLQVVIEDYVHHEGAKMATMICMKFAVVFLAVLSVVSVMRVAFGG